MPASYLKVPYVCMVDHDSVAWVTRVDRDGTVGRHRDAFVVDDGIVNGCM